MEDSQVIRKVQEGVFLKSMAGKARVTYTPALSTLKRHLIQFGMKAYSMKLEGLSIKH